jgi:hypothetical protein
MLIAVVCGALALAFIAFMKWRMEVHLHEATVIPLWERIGYGIAMFLKAFSWLSALPIIAFSFFLAFITGRR